MNILVLCANNFSVEVKTAYHILKYELKYFSKEDKIFNMYYIGKQFEGNTNNIEEG